MSRETEEDSPGWEQTERLLMCIVAEAKHKLPELQGHFTCGAIWLHCNGDQLSPEFKRKIADMGRKEGVAVRLRGQGLLDRNSPGQ